jgi:ribosomal protein L40E
MVDEVRSATGAKTGRLICLECQAELPDQADKTLHK